MSGPIVRTGTTPEFWKNWDQVFGQSAKTAAKKSSSQTKSETTKSAATPKKVAKKSGTSVKKAAKKKK